MKGFGTKWEILQMLIHFKFPISGKTCYICKRGLHFWSIGGIVPINGQWELICQNLECVQIWWRLHMSVDIDNYRVDEERGNKYIGDEIQLDE